MKALILLLALVATARAQTATGVDLRTVRGVVISTGTGISDSGTIRVVSASNGPATPVSISSVAIYNVVGSSIVIRCTDAAGGIVACGSGTSSSSFAYISASVPVSGGSGVAIFSSTGTIKQCSTSVPTNAVYDFEISSNDADDFPVFGRAKVPGRAVLVGDRFLLGAYKLTISDASIDGTYKSLCVVKL